MTTVVPDDSRRRELASNLAGVRRRLAEACAAAGRGADEVTLVAVTKTFPAADVAALAALGVTDVGENRDQEARAKHEACGPVPVRWHFLGQLQRNKARSVASYADVVHSLDRVELVDALSRGAIDSGRTLEVLVQVSLDGATGRGGVAPAYVGEIAASAATAPGLRLAGVMAVAPLHADPDEAFRRLAEVVTEVRATHPEATWMSAGMSADLEAAVRHGATHVRVGSALLGRRPPVSG